MHFFFRSLPLTTVCDSGEYNLHPYLESNTLSDELLMSLQYSGILHPPLLLERNTTYDIVSGRKRLYFVSKYLKKNTCFCRILPTGCNSETILTLLLEDQFQNGKLSFFEQAHFCSLAEKLLGEEKRIQKFFSTIPPGRITKGRQYLLQSDNYSDTVKRSVHLGLISEKALSPLSKFRKNDQEIIMRLFAVILPGQNKQKHLLQELIEITRRNEISITAFLQSPQITEILDHPEMNPHQKCEQLLIFCYQKNNPMLRAATQSFAKTVEKLKLPQTCKIEHSQAFERDEITLRILFPDFESLQEKWEKIRQEFS